MLVLDKKLSKGVRLKMNSFLKYIRISSSFKVNVHSARAFVAGKKNSNLARIIFF